MTDFANTYGATSGSEDRWEAYKLEVVDVVGALPRLSTPSVLMRIDRFGIASGLHEVRGLNIKALTSAVFGDGGCISPGTNPVYTPSESRNISSRNRGDTGLFLAHGTMVQTNGNDYAPQEGSSSAIVGSEYSVGMERLLSVQRDRNCAIDDTFSLLATIGTAVESGVSKSKIMRKHLPALRRLVVLSSVRTRLLFELTREGGMYLPSRFSVASIALQAECLRLLDTGENWEKYKHLLFLDSIGMNRDVSDASKYFKYWKKAIAGILPSVRVDKKSRPNPGLLRDAKFALLQFAFLSVVDAGSYPCSSEERAEQMNQMIGWYADNMYSFLHAGLRDTLECIS